MSPNVPSQPAPILSGGVDSMLGAQGAVAGPGMMFAGSAGAGAGASGSVENPARDASTRAMLKFETEDLPHQREQGRRVIEELTSSRLRNNPWVQEMKRLYEENGGRPPREHGYKSWQEVYDQFEAWRSNPDNRDTTMPQMRKWPRGGRR